MGSFRKSVLSTSVPQVSIFVLFLFLLYINDIPDDVVYNIVIYADETEVLGLLNSSDIDIKIREFFYQKL